MVIKRSIACILLFAYAFFYSGAVYSAQGAYSGDVAYSGLTASQAASKFEDAVLQSAGLSAEILSNPSAVPSMPPSTAARAAVVMEASSKRVLYAKNPHMKLPMASTTKIMTAILAIEMGNLEDVVTVSPKAVGVEGSSIYLAKGERLTLEQLLYGLMLRSGNDAAVAIAEHIGGSVENFVRLMNRKAVQIGARNTNFVNPHGLHDDMHYTTAYDLALISAYAMQNPVFRTIVSTKYKKIPWEGRSYDRVLQNKNALLWSYEGANGIKTGYTKVSRRCLASAALRDGMQLVCVVLDCQPWFDDSATLLDYGFANFKPYTVVSKKQVLGHIPVRDGYEAQVAAVCREEILLPVREGEEKEISVEVKLPQYLKAPVKAGTKVGYVKVTLGDEVSIRKDLYTAADVKENTIRSNLKRIIDRWIDTEFGF
ncbi:D-alanyl-D-alanine carboxypeptidase (penicillin-binding protein 5/6) [Caldicoprobacter faecalis]|uniref:serine-type D-Ala-D-Ala carboxypeptidase n=1 Tax=Caldicoprobacter faecalis TaxID=937334 RepID=A0A1I5TJ41_9FIRM|nr:D-alanyl-D-alanine carboxypeptidase (penicillin-binding protein 5/6) [Caldicoprobacter faecalis]